MTQLVSLKPQDAVYVVDSHKFDDGVELKNINLHYTTLGQHRGNNAVLFLHGTNSTSQHMLTPEFMSTLYAAGKPLDVNNYYLILPDAFGHGRSTKPTTFKGKFPHYNYTDIVNLQYRLIREALHIDHLHIVMGISMGGMQSWMWSIMFPQFMDAIMPIVCLPQTIQGRNLLWRRMLIEGSADGSLATMMLDGVPQLEGQLKTASDCKKFIADSQKEFPINDDLKYAFDASRDYHPEDKLSSIIAQVFALNFSDDELNPDQLGTLELAMRSVRNGSYVVQEPVYAQVSRSPYEIGSDVTYGHMTSAHPALWAHQVKRFTDSLANPVQKPWAVLAQFVTDAKRKDSVHNALLKLGQGSLTYRVHQLKTNPAAFYSLSTWSDQKMLDDHILQALSVPDLVGPVSVTRARMLSPPNTAESKATINSSSQITLVPFFIIKKGEIETVKNAHLSVVDSTRNEPGCIDYDLYQAEDPSVMFFYENWTNQAALDKHMNTNNFYRVVRAEVDPRLVVPWTALSMSLISKNTGDTKIAQNKSLEEKIDEFFETQNTGVLNWNFECKMWAATCDPSHPEYMHWFNVSGPFEKASEENKWEVATCCHTTAGMLREYLCGDSKWIPWTPSETPPAILNVLFTHDKVPAHELIIIDGTLVVQSNYEKYKVQAETFSWKEIYSLINKPVALASFLDPSMIGEPLGEGPPLAVDGIVYTVPETCNAQVSTGKKLNIPPLE